jgi:hypothetical protein
LACIASRTGRRTRRHSPRERLLVVECVLENGRKEQNESIGIGKAPL